MDNQAFLLFSGVYVCSYTHVCVWRPQVNLAYVYALDTVYVVFNWPWTCQVGEHPGSTRLCFSYAGVTRLCPRTWIFPSSGGGLRSSSTLPAEPTLQPRSLFFLSSFIKCRELNCLLKAEFFHCFSVLNSSFWTASHLGPFKLFRNFLSMGLWTPQSSSGCRREGAGFSPGLSCSLASGRVSM